MTDEEKKAWDKYVEHVKVMAGNPVLLEEMSFIKPVLAADAELKRLREAAEWALVDKEALPWSLFKAELRRRAAKEGK